MGSRSSEIDDQSTVDSTPEDVAALYSWANLQGAKYRDYSASRREYRAQVRYRAAKVLLERELAAQLQAEASAARAERAALKARTSVDLQYDDETQSSPISSLRNAEEAARKASSERVEAARRTEAAARAAVLAVREGREISEAHSSSTRQAWMYEESELRRRQLAGPQPYGPLGRSYLPASAAQGDLRGDGPENLQQLLHPRPGDRAVTPDSFSSLTSTAPRGDLSPFIGPLQWMSGAKHEGASEETSGAEIEREGSTPAWLHSAHSPVRPPAFQATSQSFKGGAAGADTLQDSRERVAARWFALKGVFENAGPDWPARQPRRKDNGKAPLLAVFSLAGGVGKTSLVASLGRALALLGEKVVVADTTSHGLLAVYFGSHADRSTAVKPVPPAAEAAGEPISLVVHDVAGGAESDRQRDILTEEIVRNSHGNHRTLLDISTGSSWLIRRLIDLDPTVLVPIAPDMNSVISLQAVERLFRGFLDSEGRPLLPFYVLNQFDTSLPLHLDVREVYRRQLGDRLLQFAIRRSPAVSEAMADGMTVVDYAPDAAVSQDYRNIALWLTSVSPPATEEYSRTRWGER